MAGQGRVAARIKAMDVVRRGAENLTTLGVVSFMFMQSEEGPELLGEEEINAKMFTILDEQNVIELAQTIRMRGLQLNHSSTRHLKLIEMQQVFETVLPPTPIPIAEIMEYDVIRLSFNKMVESEGFKELWQPGEDPPAPVLEWWGENDHDIFRLYINQNISKEMMDMVRNRYREHQKNGIGFFKNKMSLVINSDLVERKSYTTSTRD